MKATNEKAKELFECLLSIDPHPIAYLWACWHDRENNSEQKVKDLMDLAVKALEKQIPKKPLEQQLNVNDDLIGLCPICKEMWVIKYKGYCANCGQKLDWS